MNVAILMATYNGSQYLSEQLDSIQAQTHREWILYVRDDDSQDDTVDILLAYAKKDKRIIILDRDSNNLGAKGSFGYLLNLRENADYTMFCDQDDVWLPTKIETTLKKMLSAEQDYGKIPILVHSDLYVVDTNLRIIESSYWKYQVVNPKNNQFHQILLTNTSTGCTVMINRALRDLAIPIPKEAVMHDWWLILVASALGKIIFLNQPFVYYRQHKKNDVGAKKFNLSYILRSNNKDDIRKSIVCSVAQAKIFQNRYADRIDPYLRKIVHAYVMLPDDTFWNKRISIFKYKFFKHGVIRTAGLLLKI